MIQHRTILHVFDNSGVKSVRCIKIFNEKKSNCGSIILVSVIELRKKNKTKIKKGSMIFAYVIKSKMSFRKKNGFRILGSFNGVILINKQKQPLASRIIGIMLRDLKNERFLKSFILSGLF